MRSLAQPHVLRSAALTALVTSLACYPRLLFWAERTKPIFYLWLTLFFVMFILWGFVFAWQPLYAHRRPIQLRFSPRLWLGATAFGLAVALFAHFLLDTKLRALTPSEYPRTFKEWTASTLFVIAFEPLFLCFAPFAFFIRLLRRQETAVALTVLLGLFILGLKVSSSSTPPPLILIAELMILRIAAGFGAVYFYLQGGVLLIWWLTLVLQLRYLVWLS